MLSGFHDIAYFSQADAKENETTLIIRDGFQVKELE